MDLSQPTKRRTVVYFYPKTSRPNEPPLEGWDSIAGARGCTPETCGFRDLHAEFAALDADVFGVSAQSTEYQVEMITRLSIPFEVLSDEQLALATALKLPTFTAAGQTLISRLTLVICKGMIEHTFYPVVAPDAHADEVIAWLKAQRV